MIRITLAQMRLSLSRLVPAGLAIALGTAFVAATLVAGNVMTRSTYDGVSAQYGQADLVVSPPASGGALFTEADLADVRDTTGVTSAAGLQIAAVQLKNGTRQVSQLVIPVTEDPDLSPLTIAEGAAPTTDSQIALPAATAHRLDVAIGDTVTASWQTAVSDTDEQASSEPVTSTVTVTGLVDDPSSAYTQSGGAALATPSATATWAANTAGSFSSLLVATADVEATRTLLEERMPEGSLVRTRDEAAADTVANLSNGANQVVAVVLGFAAVALLVAALVIANTFQVIVAQRTRTLALLRCVGARRSQLRGSVLLEGLVLGLGASFVGVIAGLGLAQAALFVLGRMDLGVPLPGTLPLTVWTLVLPLLVGTAVTVGACLVPARAATRVPPVAALRPAETPALDSGAGRLRAVLALVLTIGGGLVLAIATFTILADPEGSSDRALQILGIAVLGGAVSFIGVLVGAVLWIPRVIAGVGHLMNRFGPAARLAAANTGRNPRRTAATSTALLIGVTLVVTMSTGAATARAAVTDLLDSHFPVDLVAEAVDDGTAPAQLSTASIDAITDVDGIAQAISVRTTAATLDGAPVTVYALTAEQAHDIFRDQSLSEALAAGEVVVPASAAQDATSLASTTHPEGVAVSAVGGAVGSGVVIAPTTLLDQLDPAAPVTAVWGRFSSDAEPITVLQEAQDSVTEAPVQVSSAAAERATYERIVDTLLGIVVGLLAVAVLIALIGVTNTLSLSVLERRRESATLRAVGMTRGQLRGTLAAEGMVIAGVSAVLGAVLGLVYGWAGSAIIFGLATRVRLAVPWSDLATVLVVALAAGLAASVLPARSAANTPPVAALAVE
ncbi:MAG: FtsX-like permease family protein [Cellulomonas sp.]|nr:FtsX-like permease family protein [Cellulomonas sp.]